MSHFQLKQYNKWIESKNSNFTCYGSEWIESWGFRGAIAQWSWISSCFRYPIYRIEPAVVSHGFRTTLCVRVLFEVVQRLCSGCLCKCCVLRFVKILMFGFKVQN